MVYRVCRVCLISRVCLQPISNDFLIEARLTEPRAFISNSYDVKVSIILERILHTHESRCQHYRPQFSEFMAKDCFVFLEVLTWQALRSSSFKPIDLLNVGFLRWWWLTGWRYCSKYCCEWSCVYSIEYFCICVPVIAKYGDRSISSLPNRSVIGANWAARRVASHSLPFVVTVSFESLERLAARLFSSRLNMIYIHYRMKLLPVNLLLLPWCFPGEYVDSLSYKSWSIWRCLIS